MRKLAIIALALSLASPAFARAGSSFSSSSSFSSRSYSSPSFSRPAYTAPKINVTPSISPAITPRTSVPQIAPPKLSAPAPVPPVSTPKVTTPAPVTPARPSTPAVNPPAPAPVIVQQPAQSSFISNWMPTFLMLWFMNSHSAIAKQPEKKVEDKKCPPHWQCNGTEKTNSPDCCPEK